MSLEFIFMIIFICCFCFIIFQLYELFLNYDYIVKFNDKYKKYEYYGTPSYNYVDKSKYDPNDNETNVDNKWRCYFEVTNSKWYGVSSLGLILENKAFGEWNEKNDCRNYIFSNFFLNYNNPCNESENNFYCEIYKKQNFKKIQ